MTESLRLADRLRIEWALWLLSQRLQDLPWRRRRAVLRDLRANLVVASAEAGAGEALRRLGNRRELAREYLQAEYGEHRPRPSWAKALFWTLAVNALLVAWMLVGHAAFTAGVLAANPADGTYAWSPLGEFGPSGDVSVVAGESQAFAMGLPVVFPLYLAVAFVVGGRAWRLFPRPARSATPVEA